MSLAKHIMERRAKGESWISLDLEGEQLTGALNKREAIAELKRSSARRMAGMIADIPASEGSR